MFRNETNRTMHAQTGSDEQPPPNIILIYSDQHRFDCVGANHHPLLETPNLDRLAAEGMNFTNAYCPTPLCTPARNSLLHGQWSSSHQAIANWDTEAPRPPEDDLPTFVRQLREAGYFLAWVGKWHVHPKKGGLAYGFDAYIPEEEYVLWRQSQGLSVRPQTNGWFGELDHGITPEQSRLAWGADQMLALLDHCAEEGRPFCLIWSPSEPHLPNIVPEPFCSMYPPENILPWPSFPDQLEGKPFIQAQMRRTWGVDRWSWADWAPIVSRYLGELTLLDSQVGRLLDGLEQLGFADKTMVVYTTDHGDMCGGHGMIDKHFVMYDDVVRVPLLVRWPGYIAPGQTSDAFICNGLDLATTFCQVAGVPVPATFQGASLLPLFTRPDTHERADMFGMYHGNQFGLYSQRMVRDRRWKYIWNATAEDELYDLARDPAELHNLIGDPRWRDELARLRGRLVAWMEVVGDPLLNTWNRAQLLEQRKC